MRESRTLELKAEFTRSFLKTVSAFANFGTGRIIFGIADDGAVAGVPSPANLCHDIENAINDSVSPMPRYTLEIQTCGVTEIVVLEVFEGADKPYRYRGKAYRRNSTSTVEVDRLELNRLVLEGQNLSFEEAACQDQNLSFNLLASQLKEKKGLARFDLDTLRTLNLYTSAGYNNAAGILADENRFPGIDMVRFGTTEDEMFERRSFEHVSVLSLLDEAMSMYALYYQPEVVDGLTRSSIDLIPHDAFREAVANALVHRMWDGSAPVRIGMFPDRVEIHSPGGLPRGITEEEYRAGRVSELRNPIVGDVFFRLGYIEKFGTGVKRIRRLYEGSRVVPRFEVSENSITVVLPITHASAHNDSKLSEDERQVLEAIPPNRLLSRADIEKATGLSKDKTVRILHTLIAKGAIATEGANRATRYRRL